MAKNNSHNASLGNEGTTCLDGVLASESMASFEQPCINRTKPSVRIEVSGIQLDVEHAWDDGYRTGVPGFWWQILSAIFGSGIMSILTLFVWWYVENANTQKILTKQEVYQFFGACAFLVVGGVGCVICMALRGKCTKDEYVNEVMRKYQD